MDEALLSDVADRVAEVLPGWVLSTSGDFLAIGSDEGLVRFAQPYDDEHAHVQPRLHALAALLDRLDRNHLALLSLDRAMVTCITSSSGVCATCEEILERLSADRSLARYLRPKPMALAASLAAVSGWIAANSPIEAKNLSVSFHEGPEPFFEDGALRVTLRVYFWEAGEIAMIKEQPVHLASVSQLSAPERIIAFLDAFARVLPLIAEHHDLERILPYEILGAAALDLKRPMIAEDFEAALIRRWKIPGSTTQR